MAFAWAEDRLEWPVAMTGDPREPYGAGTARIQDEVAAAGGWTWRRSQAPMARLLLMAERGEAFGWGLRRTPEREAVFAFSDRVVVNHVWLVTRADLALSASLESLRGRTVCLRRGEQYSPAFEASRDRDFQVMATDGDPEARLRMVAGGRCDLTLVSRRLTHAGMTRYLRGLPEAMGGLKAVPVPLEDEGLHFIVGKGTALALQLPRLNQAIQASSAAVRAFIESE